VFGLAHLLSPVRFSEFKRRYWTSQPLFLRRSSGYYDSLITLKDLEAILNGSLLRFPSIRLVKRGNWVAPQSYTYDVSSRDVHFRQIIDAEKVLQQFNRGTTLVFQALHLHSSRIGIFCQSIQEKIGFGASANAYITPPGARGFARHADSHEVFVLQIAGSKRWNYQMPGDSARDIEVSEGDLLYLPMGVKHHASTDITISVHLTVGVDTQSPRQRSVRRRAQTLRFC
jgi:ribosomal protein L16 Arg81 hydroxylase